MIKKSDNWGRSGIHQ